MVPQSNILAKVPFLRFTLTFGTGVVTGYYLNFCVPLLIISTFIGFSLLLFYLFGKGNELKQNYVNSVLIAIFFISIGIIYSSYSRKNTFKDDLSLSNNLYGIVLEKNQTSNDRYKYKVQLEAAQDSIRFKRVKEKIIVFVQDSLSNEVLQVGTKIQFNTKLYPLTETNNPGEFSYKTFMERQGIRYQAYLRKPPQIIPGNKYNAKTYALKLREKLLKQYIKHNIKGDEFSVLAALTLGDKNYLSTELKSSFASSGAMHVLAVSGLHVGILFYIISFLLTPLSKSRRFKSLSIIVILLFLWGYAFLTGLSPSVMRACTMFSLIAIGKNIKRRTNIYNTIAFSAFVLMLADPQILTQVGFQLSYAAVLSIVYFQPKIAALLHSKYKILNLISGLFAVSIAAQIGTFPLSIYYFHQFPTYFWLSNYIVIPAASILLYGSFLFFITLPIPFLSTIFAFILNLTTKCMNFLIVKCEALPGSLIENIWINNVTVLLTYLLLISIAIFFTNPKAKSLIWILSLLLVVSINSLRTNINIQKQNLIIFYNNYTEPLFSIIDGTKHFYYSKSDSLSNNSKRILENTTGLLKTQQAIHINNSLNKTNNLVLYGNYIFFKNVSIQLITKELNDSNDDQFACNIEFDLTKSEIGIKKPLEFKQQILKKGKLISRENTESDNNFKTLNNSAIIISPSKIKN